MTITTKDPELVPEAILDKDGLKVSKSPWGPDDEIGRLNWITPERLSCTEPCGVWVIQIP